MILTILVSSSFARNLYVDASRGNDSTTYASNSSSAPWASLSRAVFGSTTRSAPVPAQAAQAGDTVYVASGIYTVVGQGDKYPYYNPVNSGTSGTPIVFRSTGGWVDLRFSSGAGGMIGAHSVNYIEWHGFRILEAYAVSRPDTGPIVLWGTTGSVIDNCYVDGNGDPCYGDNHNGVRLEEAVNCTVRNCQITNIRTGTCGGAQNARNAAGIMMYSVRGTIIENNTIWNAGSGIILKGETTFTNTSNAIRYNLVYSTGFGIYFQNAGPTQESERNYAYQNIVRDCTAFGIAVTADPTRQHYATIRNNTVDGCVLNLAVRLTTNASNIVFLNNISTNPGSSGEVFNAGEATNLTSWSSNNNMYYGQDRWSYNAAAYTSLAAWRTASGDEVNSTVANPNYVNRTGKDFHLQAGSPALTSSNTGGPAGAYITGSETIGVSTSGSPTPPPVQRFPLYPTIKVQ